MTEADVIKLLLGALGVAGSVIAFLFYRLEKAKTECEKELKILHEAHKAEMRENGKALLQVTQQLVQSIERLSDLEEQRRR